MLFFEFLDSLNEAHSHTKGLVNASDIRKIKAIVLDIIGDDFKVRDALQAYAFMVDCLSILNFDTAQGLSLDQCLSIKERASNDLLKEVYHLEDHY